MIEEEDFDGYRVERLLGRGGMGVVYEAVQTSLDRRVALKVLRPELARDREFVERFRREGRIQAAIEHPHVLDLYEVGERPSGELFLAMRLVIGPTLADLLHEGDLDGERALDLLDQVADALDAAHRAGLVHRDVKPQNVLIGEGDQAFLADFGLSRAGDDPATSSRPVLGTVAYVAPEVVRGEDPGPASDRYAFAATLFHCLTGDVVFPRGSDAAALYAHASEPVPAISERRAELPAELDEVFEAALAKDPADRPETAQALIASVRQCLGSGVADLGPPEPRAAGSASPPTIPSPVRLPSKSRKPPSRRLGVLAAVAVAAALAGAGVAVLLGDDDDASGEVPVPPLAEGAQALGSSLGQPDGSVGCRGPGPGPRSPACAIVQADLPGSQILAPADGMIVGWSVRGADGELALDVIRPRGEDTVRIGRSQWESAGNSAPHSFPAAIPVERGDIIGVELGAGASIGVQDTDGATTETWFSPGGGLYGSPDREASEGFDYELSLRADFVPGAEPRSPDLLTGAEAERAPEGTVRKRVNVEISEPPAVVTVELVEVGDRVALDLVRRGETVARMYVPDLVPGGQPIDLKGYTYDGDDHSEVDVWWVNPASGRLFFHFFSVSQRRLEYIG